MSLHKALGNVVFPAFQNLIWRLPSRQKTVYLTFDDGPYPPVTTAVLEILRHYGVPAVFFLSGETLYRFRSALQTLDYTTYRLGNHGFRHHPYFCLSRKQLRREIRLTDALIRRVRGEASDLFRPPYGIFGAAVNHELEKLGKDLVLWSLLSNDFKWEASRVLAHLQKKLQPGDIVVFHDSEQSKQTIIKVLPDFIDFCIRNGYRFGLL